MYNYGAICGIYFLASLGLGGNIPIDATIALEFLPQSRRFLVSLLSMWQPIGVVVASGIAYGTTAKWRCGAELPSCKAVGAGEACCTVSSNMGWRYNLIVLGAMTLFIFFLRYFVFRFHESPKFLLSRGREAEAIAVLHRIAKFNKAPPPTLTLEMFHAIDHADGVDPIEQPVAEVHESEAGLKGPMKIFARVKRMVGLGPKKVGGPSRAEKNKAVLKNAGTELTRLKKIFTNKLSCFIFILLGITYMGDYWSFNLAGNFLPLILLRNNVSTGRGTVRDTYQQYVISESKAFARMGERC